MNSSRYAKSFDPSRRYSRAPAHGPFRLIDWIVHFSFSFSPFTSWQLVGESFAHTQRKTMRPKIVFDFDIDSRSGRKIKLSPSTTKNSIRSFPKSTQRMRLIKLLQQVSMATQSSRTQRRGANPFGYNHHHHHLDNVQPNSEHWNTE